MTRAKNIREVLRRESDAGLRWALAVVNDSAWKRRICAELGRRASKEAAPDLLRTLHESRASVDWDVLEAAAEALGRIGAGAAGPALTEILATSSIPVSVRDTAAFALSRLAYRPATSVLLASLVDPSKTVRLCAVAALSAIADPDTIPRLEAFAASESDQEVRNGLRDLVSRLRVRRAPDEAGWLLRVVGPGAELGDRRSVQPTPESTANTTSSTVLATMAQRSSARADSHPCTANDPGPQPKLPWRAPNSSPTAATPRDRDVLNRRIVGGPT